VPEKKEREYEGIFLYIDKMHFNSLLGSLDTGLQMQKWICEEELQQLADC
jgi:hypothetical protein